MVFCRGCGKQIHETAPNCPMCGAVQGAAAVTVRDSSGFHWASLTSFISGGVLFLLFLIDEEETWSLDQVIGGLLLGALPIIFGVIAINNEQGSRRWMGITGCVLGVLMLLVSIGSA